MSINANTSVLEYERLTQDRYGARMLRKAYARRRYQRYYARVSDRREGLSPNNCTFNYAIDAAALAMHA